ncbi:ROK family protein [Brucella anthropi]|jgi:N-acetylglucosamine kinase|uniref:ROK family protein n=1 Tax=Brucella anthropi TaxID=529 RepID=A0A6I0DK60_BRUAN|nr:MULTISPECIES: ROK family protein [Brucella/Ochrobactrum group]MCR5941997.1 ROK family protein [Ochrobactrum sp. XJ1]QOD65387.1 ROK family protein [Ochrobactrum sp. MT180101]QTN05076.1 ROK family protein [Ochrobactrum sp. EEELCW01]KAB2740224.1 ROK family protein [Brucella anthropi]KAB2755696.1 ROK family protein [Brucella anthropi]
MHDRRMRQSRQAGTVFAADVGGSFIRLARSVHPGHIELLEKLPTPASSWDEFGGALETVLRTRASDEVGPLALSIAGLVDPVTSSAFSANIPCITDHRLSLELGERLERQVIAANDADCLALAEAIEGAGKGHDIVFCAVLGTGVGGGLVIDGRLVRGKAGLTGEWGHGPILNTYVEIDGQTVSVPRFDCGCGQSGCVDTIGGARGIEKLHQFLNGIDASSHAVLQEWLEGRPEARRTITAYLQLVADPLAAVVNITGTSIIPVGGGLATASELISALDTAVRARILRKMNQPLVVPGVFGSDGGLVGAAILGHQT